ncbi:MAG: FAD-dependent oxidoreductase [Mariprofundaceae bacterium]
MQKAPAEKQHPRHGFKLSHQISGPEIVLDQANYCIWCHHQQRDSCSKGMRDKKSGSFRRNAFDLPIAGCPLEECISEMNMLMAQGCTLGALAAVTVHNPMAAGTGFRICNDCIKGCIYQRQEAVNIPLVETATLKDVLSLPWGFEIYSLLTRWNPLNLNRPVPEKESGYKVLVVGLGPAGYTLAHHLMNDGHRVVGIDGLKIEPLPEDLSGISSTGDPAPFKPVRNVQDLYESLDERIMAGFGGVAEYGITVRWDKNFLKLIRLLLVRRQQFAMYGGVRFGGAIGIDAAFNMGFDHIALCMGAGNPTFISIPNIMAPGVRAASDFLMSLQLSGASKSSSLANMQIRMPVVIIGGGLTATDAATESLAYYPVQVEKFLNRYEVLCEEQGEAELRSMWTEEETIIADEFIHHARMIRAERQAAANEDRKPEILSLLDSWGGVTIVYRRRMIDSPAYTLNDEEVSFAMEEGIRFAELLSPLAVEVDAFGHADGLKLAIREADASGRIADSGKETRLPARTILVAAGTSPNTVLSQEDSDNIQLNGYYFQAVDSDGKPVTPEPASKPEQVHVLMNVRPDGRAMSFYGDLHPSYAGNVVRAMASAKNGCPIVSRHMKRYKPSGKKYGALRKHLDKELQTVVKQVNQLAPGIMEIIVCSPMAARTCKPGQFFRLQNFETSAGNIDGTSLAMEGIALGGAVMDPEQGIISLILHESEDGFELCRLLQPGDPVLLMGPTGRPTEIVGGETVFLLGQKTGHTFLPSIGHAFRSAGSRVIYFASYKEKAERYKAEQIEAAADIVVWCCEESPGLSPNRTQDRSFTGNLIEALMLYDYGMKDKTGVSLSDADRLIAIGPQDMIAAVARARQEELKALLKPGHKAFGNINSPMQCMMKKVCACCLQTHHDPETGKQSVVYSCCEQDQPLDKVDFNVLRDRIGQNSAQAKLTRQWLTHCLNKLNTG